ncbi:ATPase AAA [Halodesulfurarchaeum formicicum]|uniref:ATPase AAA n=1 Tax=Halodesulfurarchaeum formicicum TaxID=1873524 RepID=A0A1J1ADL0_9EURY|nr:ATPase AAA [Halodesulfurarchaeum formicicum]
MGEFQRIIDDGHYENLLDAFDEDSGEQTDPFGPIQSGEYEGVEEATADVLDRISDSDEDIQKFHSELSKAIVSDWTEPLKNIAVQTASEISKEEQVLIEQIQRVYDENEEWLSDRAEDLGVGSLFALDPSQVLYMALLRDIQSEIPEISRLNINHVKLKTIFNEEYSVVSEGQGADEVQHPLIDYLNANTDEISVHTFTAPPDYWLTSFRRRAISFGEEHRNRWNKVSEGDLALFHSRAEPGNPALESQPAGFIGAGIVGQSYTVEDDWWWDEIYEGKSFPYILSFDRLFLTSDITSIDQSITILEESDEEIEDQIETLTEGLLTFSRVNDRCEEEVGKGIGAQGSFQTFRSENGKLDYERPRIILQELAQSLSESSPVNIHYSANPNLSTEILDGLYFPGNQGEEIINEIEAAIRSGKHVILTGPPGTGKTEIAERVAQDLAESHPHLYTGSQVTTATADWSTFDTVGGYMPSESQDTNSGESLSFTPGTVLNRLRHTHHDVPINEPLVIDELNRADIDKAFGQLFTVLSGQPVTLPYTRNGDEVEILPVNDLEGSPRQNQYPIPNSWRLLATMNTYDKTSLYEMSYAFMRRFAFIRVGVPDLDGNLDTLMEEYISAWEDGDEALEINLSDRELRAVGQVWQRTNSAVEGRSIGPAIVRDLVLFVENHDDRKLKPRLTRAVIAYVFPQLEGVPKRQEIVESIAKLQDVVDSETLKDAASEMLQITFEED